jgi:hypothetical protein
MADTNQPSMPGARLLANTALPDIPPEPVRPNHDWSASKLEVCDMCGTRTQCVKADGENHCASCVDGAYLGAWKDYAIALRTALAVVVSTSPTDGGSTTAMDQARFGKLITALTVCKALASNRNLRNLDTPDAEVDGGDAVELLGALWPSICQATAPL